MLDDATKAVFVAAAERRKQRGIVLKRVCFMADETQVDTFNMVWNDWTQRFGKEDAVDFLLASMCESQVRLMEYDHAQRTEPKRRRRTSAAKVS
jgi:hypothetical protein